MRNEKCLLSLAQRNYIIRADKLLCSLYEHLFNFVEACHDMHACNEPYPSWRDLKLKGNESLTRCFTKMDFKLFNGNRKWYAYLLLALAPAADGAAAAVVK